MNATKEELNRRIQFYNNRIIQHEKAIKVLKKEREKVIYEKEKTFKKVNQDCC